MSRMCPTFLALLTSIGWTFVAAGSIRAQSGGIDEEYETPGTCSECTGEDNNEGCGKQKNFYKPRSPSGALADRGPHPAGGSSAGIRTLPSLSTRYEVPCSGVKTDYPAASTGQGNNWFPSIPKMEQFGGDPKSGAIHIRWADGKFRRYVPDGIKNQSETDPSIGHRKGAFYNRAHHLKSQVQGGAAEHWLYDDEGNEHHFAGGIGSELLLSTTNRFGETTTFLHDFDEHLSIPKQVIERDHTGSIQRTTTYEFVGPEDTTPDDLIESITLVDNLGRVLEETEFSYHLGNLDWKDVNLGDLAVIDRRTHHYPQDQGAAAITRETWVYRYYEGFDGVLHTVSKPPTVERWIEEFGGANRWDAIFAMLETPADLLVNYEGTGVNYVDEHYAYEDIFSGDFDIAQLTAYDGCGSCAGSNESGDYEYEHLRVPGLQFNAGNCSFGVNDVVYQARIRKKVDGVVRRTMIFDYNVNGQVINETTYEGEFDPAIHQGARYWTLRWEYDSLGRIAATYSQAATYYYNPTPIQAGAQPEWIPGSAGLQERMTRLGETNLVTQKSVGTGAATTLTTVEETDYLLREPVSGERRFYVVSEVREYPDGNPRATRFEYDSWHSGSSIAEKEVRAILPDVAALDGGTGATGVTIHSFYDAGGMLRWRKLPGGFVHFWEYDLRHKKPTLEVTDGSDQGVPQPASSVPPGYELPADVSGQIGHVHRVRRWLYDSHGRTISYEDPRGQTTKWLYTKLGDVNRVTIEYPHVAGTVNTGPIRISVQDIRLNVTSSIRADLSGRDADLTDDWDPTWDDVDDAHAIGAWSFYRRTDYVFVGNHLEQIRELNDPHNLNSGDVTWMRYSADGLLDEVENAVGTVTSYTYDALDRRKTKSIGIASNPTGYRTVEAYYYDGEESDPNATGDSRVTKMVRFSHAGSGSSAPVILYEYHYRGWTEALETPGMRRVEYDHDELGRTTSTRTLTPSGGAWVLLREETSEYDARGQVYQEKLIDHVSTGSREVVSRHWHDDRGNVIKTRRNGQRFEKATFDGLGRVVVSTVSYDNLEYDTQTWKADDVDGDRVFEQEEKVYDQGGLVILSRNLHRNSDATTTGSLDLASARGSYVATWYDELGRLETNADYGDNGGVYMTARPTRPTQSDPNSHLVTRQTYYDDGNLYSAIDEEGKARSFIHDKRDRVEQVVEDSSGEQRTTTITYDALSRPLTRTADNVIGSAVRPQTTQYIYGVRAGVNGSFVDSNDIPYIIRNPDPSNGMPSSTDEVRYSADALGRIVERRDQNGTVRRFTYDARDRVVSDAAITIPSGVDNQITEIEWGYDALDRVTRVTSIDSSGTPENEVVIEHDPLGGVTKVWQEHSGAVHSNSKLYEIEYTDPTSTSPHRRLYLNYPDGDRFHVGYVGAGYYLNRATQLRTVGTWQTVFKEEFLGEEVRVSRTHSLGTTTIVSGRTFDRFFRTQDLTLGTDSNPDAFNSYRYYYDVASRVTAIDDLQSAYWAQSYEYDGLGRVDLWKRGDYNPTTGSIDLTLESQTWNRDHAGNWLSHTVDGVTTAATFNDSNEILVRDGYNYGHDDAGNRVTHGPYKQYTYDAWNRLVAFSDYGGSDVSIKYNGLGQRIQQSWDTYYYGTARRYYYDENWQIIEEHGEDEYGYPTGILRNFVWGFDGIDDLVATGPSIWRYHFQDANNNVVTKVNSDGTIDSRFVYDTFGMPRRYSADYSTYLPIDEGEHLFACRPWVSTLGFYDNRRRLYDPETGRFLQRDPLGLWGDKLGFGNAYPYARNDPANMTDPYGELPILVLFWAFGLADNAAKWFEVWMWMYLCWDCVENAQDTAKHMIEKLCDTNAGPKGRDTNNPQLEEKTKKCIEREGDKQLDSFLSLCTQPCANAKKKAVEAATDLALSCVASSAKTTLTLFRKGKKGLERLKRMRKRVCKLCFTSETLVWTEAGLVEIQDIDVGDRVLTSDPAGDAPLVSRVSPDSWAVYTLVLGNTLEGRGEVLVRLLRPRVWAEQTGAVLGARVVLELGEDDFDGYADVVSIEPAPLPACGAGRVVTGTISYETSNVLEMTFGSDRSKVQMTAHQPIFSLSSMDWVEAHELLVGERLKTLGGETEVASVVHNRGTFRVHTLEVEGDQQFFVGEVGLLGHNCGKDAKRRTPEENRKARNKFKNNKQEAREAWEKETGQDWPVDENGKPWPAEHTPPLKEGGDPMKVTPRDPGAPDPHNIPGPDGKTDYQRWGAEGTPAREARRGGG